MFHFHKWARPAKEVKVGLYKKGKYVRTERMVNDHPYAKSQPDESAFFGLFKKKAGKKGSGFDEARLYRGASLVDKYRK